MILLTNAIDAIVGDRIFEPFFTTTPVGAGQGLGLAIAHGIVAKHNGTLQIASSSDAGSTFSFELPLRQVT